MTRTRNRLHHFDVPAACLLRHGFVPVRRRVAGPVLVAVAILLVMLLGIASASGPWSDMPEERWVADYGVPVSAAVAIYSGFPDGSFRPYDPEAPEQFAGRAGRALGVELAAAREGEVSVSAPGRQRVAEITRGEAAVILAEYLAGVEADATARTADAMSAERVRAVFATAEAGGALDTFSDVARISEDQRPALAYLVSHRVFQGDGEGRLLAEAPLLRAQAVAVVFRTLAARDRLTTGDVFGHVFMGGGKRTFLLRVPESYARGTEPVPLLLVFHGVLDTGEEIAAQTDFSALAEEEGFIVVYPDGLGRRWNAGFFRPDSPLDAAAQDDVVFVDALIDRLAATYRIDTTRVYAAGFSNGGMFSYRLGAERSETFAAIASVAGTMPEPLARSVELSRPVPVIAFHGTEDPVVPFGGGTIGFMNLNLLSVEDTMRTWIEAHGSWGGSRALALPDVDLEDGTRVSKRYLLAGEGDAAMELYVIEGGGHTWPGSPTANLDLSPMVGRTSFDIDATRVIWDFFKEHRRLDPSDSG